ncbi:POMGNT2 [Scenedesmus sp. PABB004]|nr:POMGNT2 [Scenedesmus sp. PABB004]
MARRARSAVLLLALAFLHVAQQQQLAAYPFHVSCSGLAASKQTCLFNNVCFVPGANASLTVLLHGTSTAQHTELARRHFEGLLAPHYGGGVWFNASNAPAPVRSDPDGPTVDHAVTLFWRPDPNNQYSFGHALVNEVFSMFLVLSNHFGDHIPRRLQVVCASSWHPVLHHLVSSMIAHRAQLWTDKMKAHERGVCYRHVLVGDGGYVHASRASLTNSGHPQAAQYASGPSFFSSRNWWAFRAYALELAGVVEDNSAHHTRPRDLVLLNDKRHGSEADRRMIMDIEQVAANLSAALPSAEVAAVRIRDLAWPDQLRVLTRTSVFITTQGSSAFRLIFLPRGAVCVMVGAPAEPGSEWESFHELDKWFPLSWVEFVKYEVPLNATWAYEPSPLSCTWVNNTNTRDRGWCLYNANIRLNASRLHGIVAPFVRA